MTKKQKKQKRSVKAAVPAVVVWASAPAAHDYPAAASYLRLIAGKSRVEMCTAQLAKAPTILQHAKDILRAARLPLLPADDAEVAKDLAKVTAGEALSPILLVRGDVGTDRPLQIADGYHRVCASYQLSEDTEIPCRLISLPTRRTAAAAVAQPTTAVKP
jgi:hypothetical protein